MPAVAATICPLDHFNIPVALVVSVIVGVVVGFAIVQANQLAVSTAIVVTVPHDVTGVNFNHDGSVESATI